MLLQPARGMHELSWYEHQRVSPLPFPPERSVHDVMDDSFEIEILTVTRRQRSHRVQALKKWSAGLLAQSCSGGE